MAKTAPDLPVLCFPNLAAWTRWLEQTGPTSPGIWLKLAKKSAPVPTLSKEDAVQGALCHGWIDGQLRPLDDDYWLIRFAPRRPRSVWSQRNRTRAITLMENGEMRPAGLREIAAAKADGRWDKAYAPQGTEKVPADFQAALDTAPEAARFFATLKGPNRYAVLYRIQTAKTEKTRAARIAKFVGMLDRGEVFYPKTGKAEGGN